MLFQPIASREPFNNINLKKSTLTLAISSVFSAAAIANNVVAVTEQEEGTLIVTATRYAQEADKIPGSISVISNEALKQQTSIADDLTSVLANLVPSITPSRQKLSNQGESMRGRTALIMVDGVPQNNPLRNGNRYGYTIDSSMLERIEVINGASAVQGNGATGGIINYVTKGAKVGDHWKQTVGTRVTSSLHDDGTSTKVHYNLSQYDDQYDLFLATSWEDQGIYYDANGNAIGMNQIQGETQDSSATNLFFKGGYNFGGGNQRLVFSVKDYNLESNNNYVAVKGNFSEGTPGTIEKGTPSGAPTSNDSSAFNLTYHHYDLADGELTLQMFMQDFEAVYGEAGWWATSTKQYDQGAITSEKKGFKLSYAGSEIFANDDNWVIGLDGLDDKTIQTLSQSGLNVTPPMKYRSLAPFMQGDMLITDNLRLSAGVRLENTWVKVQNSETLYGYGNEGQHNVDIIGGEKTFTQTVFNTGLVYNFTDDLSGYVGFNQGFGLPDIGRVLRGNWVGNANPGNNGDAPIDFNTMPAVEPVVTDNYEIGINYSDKKWDVSANTYLSIAKDGANLSLNDGGTYDVERQRTDISGYELTVGYQIQPATKLQAMYAHVGGRVDTDEDGKVDRDMDLKNVSPDRLMLAANHKFNEQLSSRLQYNYLFSDEVETLSQEFNGYGLADLSVNYNSSHYGRISLGIENLLNEQYINYFSQIRNHSSYYFSGRGRTYSVSYEIDF